MGVPATGDGAPGGTPVHMGCVAVVALAALGWFLWWWLPVAIVAAAFAVMGCMALAERIRGRGWRFWRPRPHPHPHVPGVRHGAIRGGIGAEDDRSWPLDPRGRCRACGERAFRCVPGRTTAEEIRAFARGAVGWKDNPEALEGWMPAGLYCPCGHVAIPATPPGPAAP